MKAFILLLSLTLLLTVPSDFASAVTADAKYAGFAFAGAHKDIPINFKYTNMLSSSTKDNDGRSIFDKELLTFFKENTPRNFNLLIGKEGDTKISMALVLTREDVSVVNIDNLYKIVFNICCNVVFIDFNDLKVVASYPLYIEYVDVMKIKPTDAEIVKLMQGLYFSNDFSILQLLKSRLDSVTLKNTARLTLKIINIEIEDPARKQLQGRGENINAYKSIMAQKFSNLLSSRLNVAMLPYEKDYMGARMALSFSDGRVVEFVIPAATYGIDFTLRKLTKDVYKEAVGEDAYLFGAYSTIKVYDPELCTIYWEKKVKYGAIKNIPKLQKTQDDFSIFDEMIGLVMIEGIKEMQLDTCFYKGVIEKCLNN